MAAVATERTASATVPVQETPLQALVSHLGDWIARGAFAGLAAGLFFLIAQMGWATHSGKPAVAPLLDMSTVFHGSSKPVITPENVVVGLVTHLNLSLAFGIVFALLVPFFRSALVLALAGVAYGLALYVFNLQILGRTLFEWFTNPMGPPQGFEVFIHAVYGLLLVPFFLGFATRLARGSVR